VAARIRCSITGTANSAVHRCSAIARRQASGSNRRCITSVARSGMPTCNADNPQLWNTGAASRIRSPARNRMRDSSATAAPSPFGVGRRAPFGVPVVPDVSTTIAAGRSGGVNSASGASPITSSSVGCPGGPASAPVRTTAVNGRPATSGANSPSATSTRTACLRTASSTCGRASPVLSSTVSAPSRPHASIVRTIAEWLRAMIATAPSGPTPTARNAAASRDASSRSSANVVDPPSSSITAISRGWRAAAAVYPPASVAPHRASARSCRTRRSGRAGASTPAPIRVWATCRVDGAPRGGSGGATPSRCCPIRRRPSRAHDSSSSRDGARPGLDTAGRK